MMPDVGLFLLIVATVLTYISLSMCIALCAMAYITFGLNDKIFIFMIFILLVIINIITLSIIKCF